MIGFRDLVAAFRGLGIDPARPLITHVSLSAFGGVDGGAETVLGALLYCYEAVIMPGFTYKTMIVPEVGPPDNGITYGARDANLMAEFYRPRMPVDRIIGVIPEALRRHPMAHRSAHPILSFVGINASQFLKRQTLAEPLGPIGALAEAGGWVALLGVNHTVNTSIHYAERLAGRKQFVRWALTRNGIVECPRFPGCSDGFERIAARLQGMGRQAQIGEAQVLAYPLVDLVKIARGWISADPLALLCDRSGCERCQEIRRHVQAQVTQSDFVFGA
jgi:aminoglycoside 3-N-acetyltransferase